MSAIPLTAERIDVVTQMSESHVVAGVRTGDHQVLATLFEGYFPLLVAFARRYVPSIDDAEELVAGLFARLWDNRATWAPRHTIESYLFAAVRNAALNRSRTEARAVRRHALWFHDEARSDPHYYIEGDISKEGTTDARESALASLNAVLGALPEPARVIIQLRWGRQMSYAEIAEVLGGTPGAVQRQHSRAMAKIRQLIERNREQ